VALKENENENEKNKKKRGRTSVTSLLFWAGCYLGILQVKVFRIVTLKFWGLV
jgi:hypothetical protein